LQKVLNTVPTKVIVLGENYKTIWMTILALFYLRKNFGELKHIWGGKMQEQIVKYLTSKGIANLELLMVNASKVFT